MPARAGRGPSDHARPAPRDAAASRPRRARRRADRTHGHRLPGGREAREARPSIEANIRRKRRRCQVRFLTSAESAAVSILHAVVTMTANRLPVGSELILLATPCFVFPLRSEKRPPPFAPWADGTDLAGAALADTGRTRSGYAQDRVARRHHPPLVHTGRAPGEARRLDPTPADQPRPVPRHYSRPTLGRGRAP